MDIEKFKVLTLNCWGVFTPIVCEKRHERLRAIGDKLSQSYYDIILLQEIWTEDDFNKLNAKLKLKYRYNNYFHSNIIGSGCCIFSKFKILSTFFYRYQSNGYPHCIYHGDWYGGKGIGLATIELGSRKYIINVYVTHMHAKYKANEVEDSYSFHRLMQGYEASEFIRLTSGSCDAVVVGGDFNMDESMLGWNFITLNSGVHDAWLHNINQKSDYSLKDAATCDRPDNPYANKKWLKYFPDGERLDYIFYRQNSCIKLICTDCTLVMRDIDENMHYSDHCGIEAKFEISQNPLENSNEINQEKRILLCQRALEKVNIEFKRVKSNCIKDFTVFIILFSCIIFDYPNSIITYFGGNGLSNCLNRIFLIIMSVACFIFLWYAICIRASERKAILNFKQSMEFIIQSNMKISEIPADGDIIESEIVDSKDKSV